MHKDTSKTGWDLFTGRPAIRERWITIFANTGMISLQLQIQK